MRVDCQNMLDTVIKSFRSALTIHMSSYLQFMELMVVCKNGDRSLSDRLHFEATKGHMDHMVLKKGHSSRFQQLKAKLLDSTESVAGI